MDKIQLYLTSALNIHH